MLAEQKDIKLKALSLALIKQREISSSTDEPIAVLFMGQQFDSFPRDLLLDDSITSVDKYAWQRLYIELQQNRNYFPTYDRLQKLWGNLGGLLSRKTVREILSRLVLSGWLSFKVIRGDNGQVVGNVYMLHNTKLELIDIITQNDESVTHILTSLMSKKNISQSLAILTYNQVKAYLNSKQSNNLFLQMNQGKPEMVITHNIDDIAPSLLGHLENLLSSKNKLSKNKLSSKKEPPIKSDSYNAPSSTSSIYSSSTTSDDSQLVIPSNLKARLTDKGMRDITNTIARTGIAIPMFNKICQSISVSDITQIKNMTAYLVRNIQKAAKGEYNFEFYHSRQEKLSSGNTMMNQFVVNELAVHKKEKQVVSKERLDELFSPLKNMLKHPSSCG
ncbi:hypothetical protein A9G48_03985 [Gilliamella sp. wkB18]|uniref:hypothetical protein n=1 Tax=Gilliamella sp. wkB18 TaxID=3120260 RepID=UPI00080E07F8|nr:hypothetical protein [Gilliamella apicola]OCG64092.1 hypothetical protein A9G48_03985 [Gilliamella apicola]